VWILAIADASTAAWSLATARRVEQGAVVVVSRERREASWETRGGGERRSLGWK
jgi:hypothetical protein